MPQQAALALGDGVERRCAIPAMHLRLHHDAALDADHRRHAEEMLDRRGRRRVAPRSPHRETDAAARTRGNGCRRCRAAAVNLGCARIGVGRQRDAKFRIHRRFLFLVRDVQEFAHARDHVRRRIDRLADDALGILPGARVELLGGACATSAMKASSRSIAANASRNAATRAGGTSGGSSSGLPGTRASASSLNAALSIGCRASSSSSGTSANSPARARR